MATNTLIHQHCTTSNLPRHRPKPPLPPVTFSYLPLAKPKPKPLKSPPPHTLPKSPFITHEEVQTTNQFHHLLHLSVHYKDTELAKAVHSSILKNLEREEEFFNTYIINALIVAYVKLGRLDYAYDVFNTLLAPDVVSYTAIISGFAKGNREKEAVGLFFEMRGSGIEPNEHTFVALLTACIRLLDLEFGCQVHALLIKFGCLDCTYVANALIGLYSKCGCSDFAIMLFDSMSRRDVVSWNTVISGVVKEGMYNEALGMFHDMLSVDGFRADRYTLSNLLAASTEHFRLSEGQQIHGQAVKNGYEGDLSVNNALLGFYTNCGTVTDVMALFRRMRVKDSFTWTEMITAYMDFGLVDSAVETFNQMPEKNPISYNALLAGFCRNGEGMMALRWFCRMVDEGAELDEFTLTSVVNACGLLMEKKTSEQIHTFVLKFGVQSNDHIEAALLDMCTRCGRMADAEMIYGGLNQNGPFNLTSMMCAYARNGQPEKAVSLFCQQHVEESMGVDEVTYATVLGLCGTIGFPEFGEQIHCNALKHGFVSDTVVGNAVLSMYCKCRNMDHAIKFFNVMTTHDVVSWNCLLFGHILHRQGDEALALWVNMKIAGLHPDSVTCLSIISAYRYTRSRLVDDCRRFFSEMKSTFLIEHTAEHYACYVGVLSHWGLLEEAEEVIKEMPFEPQGSVWRALLDGCRIHQNASTGERAAKKIISLEPQDPSTYILKSNLYSASGRWHCSEMVREEMREKGLRKIPAQSWIIYQNKVHSFFARDESHSASKDIYSGLEILILECLKIGYVPDTSYVLHEVEEHQKKDFLFKHSAKLAVTFGLLVTRPGKPVRVMKNIMLCGDCHTFFKYVSIATKREIHVRDASGFHCFLDGKCSCEFCLH